MNANIQPRQPRPSVKPVTLLRSLFTPNLFHKPLERKSIASKLNIPYSTLADHISGNKNPSFDTSLAYSAAAADEGNIVPAMIAAGKLHTVVPVLERFFLNGSLDDEIAKEIQFLGEAKKHFDNGDIGLASKYLDQAMPEIMAMQQELLKRAARRVQ